MMADASEGMTNAHTPQAIVPDDQLLSALVEFSAAAGHEINNPLGVILGRVQLLLQQEADPVRRQSLETIAGQAWRIRDMIGDVMTFADPPPPSTTEIVVLEVAEEVRKSVCQQNARMGTPSDAEITLVVDPELTIQGDRDQFAAVLAELLHNATHPSVAANKVEIVAEADSKDAQFCRVIIRDDGRGLTPEEATHMFNPFYSRRQAGRGLGFGLSKAWRLAEQNGGRLKVSARVEPADSINKTADADSTEFILRWPRTEKTE